MSLKWQRCYIVSITIEFALYDIVQFCFYRPLCHLLSDHNFKRNDQYCIDCEIIYPRHQKRSDKLSWSVFSSRTKLELMLFIWLRGPTPLRILFILKAYMYLQIPRLHRAGPLCGKATTTARLDPKVFAACPNPANENNNFKISKIRLF